MRLAVSVLLGVAAIIHLLPLSGVLSAGRLEALYGVPISEPNLLLAMRHRAVLFGLLGALLLAAAFVPALHPVALIGGLLSDVAFLVFAVTTPGLNEKMRRVVVADIVSVACLLAAAALLASG